MSEKCNLYYVGGLLMAVGAVGTILCSLSWATNYTVALVEPVRVPLFHTLVGYSVGPTLPGWVVWLLIVVAVVWALVIGLVVGYAYAKRQELDDWGVELEEVE